MAKRNGKKSPGRSYKGGKVLKKRLRKEWKLEFTKRACEGNLRE